MQELIRDLERVLGHGTVAEDARNQMQTELNNLKKDADGRKNKLVRKFILPGTKVNPNFPFS